MHRFFARHSKSIAMVMTTVTSLFSFSCSSAGFGGFGLPGGTNNKNGNKQLQQASADIKIQNIQTFRERFESIIHELNLPGNRNFELIQAKPTELTFGTTVAIETSVNFLGYNADTSEEWASVIENVNENIRSTYSTMGEYFSAWGVHSVADLDLDTSIRATEHLVEVWAQGPTTEDAEEISEESISPTFELLDVTQKTPVAGANNFPQCTQAGATTLQNQQQCIEDGNVGNFNEMCDYTGITDDNWGAPRFGKGTCPPKNAHRPENMLTACVEYLAQTQTQYVNACVACQSPGANCGSGTAQPDMGTDKPWGYSGENKDPKKN